MMCALWKEGLSEVLAQGGRLEGLAGGAIRSGHLIFSVVHPGPLLVCSCVCHSLSILGWGLCVKHSQDLRSLEPGAFKGCTAKKG